MPGRILNRVTIYGLPDDIENFKNDILDKAHETELFGLSADFGDNIYIEDNELQFNTGGSYAENWLNQIKLQYPHLIFSLFWYDETNPPDYGFIDTDGAKTSIIDNREGFILASKLLRNFKLKLIRFSDIQRDQIKQWIIEPSFQLSASPNKIITLIYNDGNVYYVKAKYDEITQQLFPPENNCWY
jgi:hypothetical protein